MLVLEHHREGCRAVWYGGDLGDLGLASGEGEHGAPRPPPAAGRKAAHAGPPAPLCRPPYTLGSPRRGRAISPA
jgi:hypothetical protein